MERFAQPPTDPVFVQDPYPFYAALRSAGDLIYWEDYGLVCAASHRAVQAVLRDTRMGREVPPEMRARITPHTQPFYDVEAHSMLELEPPRHTRLRGLVLRAFTSRRIRDLTPEIEALCHRLIDGFKPEPDLIPAYATPIPVIVIARLLGVPESMAPDLLRWSNSMVTMYQARRTHADEVAASEAARDFSEFMRGYVDDRRSDPADDLITHLIAAEEDGEKLSTDELITTCILLLNAGHEATVHTLGNGLRALLSEDVDALATTRAGTVAGTVEEILRWDPPLHMFTRWIYEDLELFGHRFRRGDQVACLLASAGRDDSVWAGADRFDPGRTVVPNSAFGAGRHFCVGAPLARLELQIGLRVLFARLPNLRLTEPPRYANLYHFHGLEALMVTAA